MNLACDGINPWTTYFSLGKLKIILINVTLFSPTCSTTSSVADLE